MNKYLPQQSFEYYPFCLADGEGAYNAYIEFVLGFKTMPNCEVKEILAFNTDNPDQSVSVEETPEALHNVFKNNPSMSVNVNGIYRGNPVSFLFTCGIMMATNYGRDSDLVEKIVTDICENSF